MSRRYSPNDKSKSKQSSTTNDDEQRYCICQKREDEFTEQDNNDFMIECDGCNGWFHGKCIGLADRIADDIEKYFCDQCSNQHGSSIFKQRRNRHRRDYSDPNADNKPTQTGTQDFIQKLKRKIFPSCEPIVTKLRGHQLTVEYLAKHGFTRPILIPNRDGLDLTLPSRTITLSEINELAGPDRFIDIIDCEKQVTYKMSFDEYIDYFESFERNKIYNVLSLEVSNTKLGEDVITPKIVRDLSWSTIGIWPEKKVNHDDEKESSKSATKTTWPLQISSKKKRQTTISSSDTDQTDDEDLQEYDKNHFENFERPEVSKYCLMSPQSSYTDFHVDFGGSSVWYSVVRGEKIFYLIEPTDENLQKYADWSRSPNESETFLGDCVTHCYKMHLKEDNTVLLPAGWIHAVYTVTDSLVFGGNFLQSMSVDMQLRVYEIERFAQVPNKFQFPLFETFHWYAAKTFYEELKGFNESNSSRLNVITQQASESILHYMNKWLINDKRYQARQRNIIPRGINCEKLLRDLARELELAKSHCGSSCVSKPPSVSIVASPIKAIVPLENKQEMVQLKNTKIKVKCRRLPNDSESKQIPKTSKMKPDLSKQEMKLTIKTALSGCRKPNSSNRDSPPIVQKKKTGKPMATIKTNKNSNSSESSSNNETTPKIAYTLDLEAKRQRFIQPSNNQLTNNHSDSDDNHSSDDINKSLINTDMNDSQDDNQEPIGGLASFVRSSIINHDLHSTKKEAKIKRERSSSDPKLLTPKKSKNCTTLDGAKLMKIPKKVKSEDSTPMNPNRKKAHSTTTPSSSSSANSTTPKATNPNGDGTTKKSLSISPKKAQANNRLGKILKIANNIKSRSGILT